MAKPIIEIRDLGKRYQIEGERDPYLSLREQLMRRFQRRGASSSEFWALRHVEFDVRAGDTVGLIGSNGAGKSTLLKLLSQITPPSEGTITLRGRVASLLEVGTGFHPELSGRENIFLNGAVLGMSRAQIRKRFDEIVAFSEVDQFLDVPVKRYSSGMYVRLAFAVAAHLDPEILVVDEVLAVGDAQFQKKCLGKMGDVARGGRTVFFVSHNLTAIRSLCSRALLLRSGALIANGSVEEVIGQYTNEVTETTLERAWHDPSAAPRIEALILRRVRVVDDGGLPLRELFTDRPFNIEIDFTAPHDGASACLFVAFRDLNNAVFQSLANQETEWYGRPMPAGEYRATCCIPANLFNDGRFTVNIGIYGKGFKGAHLEYDVLRLEILDGPALRGDYFGPYWGPLRPRLDWRIEPLTAPIPDATYALTGSRA